MDPFPAFIHQKPSGIQRRNIRVRVEQRSFDQKNPDSETRIEFLLTTAVVARIRLCRELVLEESRNHHKGRIL